MVAPSPPERLAVRSSTLSHIPDGRRLEGPRLLLFSFLSVQVFVLDRRDVAELFVEPLVSRSRRRYR
jgi:hypothetical protein